eukprot:TRINITY_DN4874_c0_g1_i1.p1 TRINITY_DN4874_c0_g1~~TRINITY_DN4874_c0_g1_i1.p1  ORF type:complete len:921 (+),score=152.17 TRINITY_DN4874_c0_g1_i1:98-2860(+)
MPMFTRSCSVVLLQPILWGTVIAETASLCKSNCFDHGACNQGVCECYDGWFGLHCDQKLEMAADCTPACANRANCVNGKCECTHGFTGADCSKVALSPAFLKMLEEIPAESGKLPTTNLKQSHPSVQAALLQTHTGANSSAAARSQAASSMVASKIAAETAHVANTVAKAVNEFSATRESVHSKVAAAAASYAATETSAISAARQAVLAANHAAALLGDMNVEANSKLGSPDHEDADSHIAGAAARLAAEVAAKKAMLLQTAPSNEATVHCEADCSGHGVCEDSGKCACATGWTGSICDMPLCPSNCNNRGLCVQGNCVCESGWYGSSCHLKRCPNDCSGAGYCFEGKCKCMNGFQGESCAEVHLTRQSIVVKLKRGEALKPRPGVDSYKETSSLRSLNGASCPDNCNHRGQCSPAGKCRCDAGYSGVSCESFCPNECSGQGRCIEGGCLCFAGFTGADCSVPGCCTGHGTCDVPGTCECDAGWGGPECSIELVCADPTCSGHGTCRDGSCHCEDGWNGPRCAAPTAGCVPQCGTKGKCNMHSKQCECEPGYVGADCSLKLKSCPKNCNFRGLCLNGVCMCGAGWNGDDCSRRYFAPGGVATGMLGDDAEASKSGANFAIDPNGVRADIALDESLGPEPRIDLNYNPAPATTLAPAFGYGAAAGMTPPASRPQAAGSSSQTASAQAAPGAVAGAMSPQAITPSLALESAQGVAFGRQTSEMDSLGKICGEGGACSGRGTCNTETGRCMCEASFFGDFCQQKHCPGFAETGEECHGHGFCDDGMCSCSSGWGGEVPGVVGMLSCHEQVCALDCGKHGSCTDGACQCQTGWQGATCQDAKCPNDCHGRGTCAAPSPDFPGKCSCNDGWGGDACELSASEQTGAQGGDQQQMRHKELAAVQLSEGFTASSHHRHREVSVVRLS